jgi:hypothetical protein
MLSIVLLEVGTIAGTGDVATVAADLAPGVDTFSVSAQFTPVHGTHYHATFRAVNGAGLSTLSFAPGALLYTALPPATRPARFGHGDQAGVHRAFDSSPRTAAYALDAVFFDVEPQRVVVMGIAHSSRRPRFWGGRVKPPHRTQK